MHAPDPFVRSLLSPPSARREPGRNPRAEQKAEPEVSRQTPHRYVFALTARLTVSSQVKRRSLTPPTFRTTSRTSVVSPMAPNTRTASRWCRARARRACAVECGLVHRCSLEHQRCQTNPPRRIRGVQKAPPTWRIPFDVASKRSSRGLRATAPSGAWADYLNR
jgi:hypothetical protein